MKELYSMKLRSIFSLFVVSFFVAFSAQSEFRCESEVRYRWKQVESSESKTVVNKNAPVPTAQPTAPAAPSDAQVSEGREVFWAQSSATGVTEDEAKALLKDAMIEQRSRADMACKDIHENQTKCVASKYSQNVSTFQVMSFTQRKSFEKKIIEDCEQAAGHCLGAAATEPICKELKKDEPTPAAEVKGKDAKKK